MTNDAHYRPDDVSEKGSAAALIPGARERNTLTYRWPGSMGGPASGSANVVSGVSSMDATTISEHQKEGGGRPRKVYTVTRKEVL